MRFTRSCFLAGPARRRRPWPPLLAALLTVVTADASAALLSGYFRHSGPNGLFINIETQQTSVTGPLSDSNNPNSDLGGSYIVDYGLIRLASANEGPQTGTGGFSNAGTTAAFQDGLTISSPSADPFSFGTLRARLDISGSLLATGAAQSLYIVNVSLPGLGPLQQISGTLYGPDIGFPPGVVGDDFGSYILEFTVPLGQPFQLKVEGNVDANVPLNQAGRAVTNLSSTIRWGGILEVLDDGGTPLGDFTVISESGYDYATLQAVPLPAAAWGFMPVLGWLGWRARRRA